MNTAHKAICDELQLSTSCQQKSLMHLSMVCPRMGGGGGVGVGQPRGNLTFSGFQMSISPPLGHHYNSNSHPWGLQIVFLVDTNLQCRIIKKLTQKYQKVRLLLKTLLVIVW